MVSTQETSARNPHMTTGPFQVTLDSDMEPLIPDFLAHRRNDVDAIRGNLEQEDFEPIRIAGHSMKGTGASYGFDQITDIGAAIETAARNSDAQAIATEVDRLAHYLDNLQISYE
jgi:HPt (histidine-containing phosphotransfer) domain-containing protein